MLGGGAAAVAVVVVTAVAAGYARLEGVEFSDLSRDPAAVAGLSPYIGYYATVTLLLWWVPAIVALFTALVLRRSGDAEGSRMLLLGGLLTATMVADDGFQGHETLTFHLDLPADVVSGVYGVAAIAFAWWFRHRLGVARLALLGAAFGCWGVSSVIDNLLGVGAPYIVEDGAKLMGVALWTLAFVRISYLELTAGHPTARLDGPSPPVDVRSGPDPEATDVLPRYRPGSAPRVPADAPRGNPRLVGDGLRSPR